MNHPKPPITLQDKRNFLMLTIAETKQELYDSYVRAQGFDENELRAQQGCERCIEALNQELLIVECHELLGYER